MNNLFSSIDLSRVPYPKVILTDWDDTLFNNELFLKTAIESLIKNDPAILKKEFAGFVSEKKLDTLIDHVVNETAGAAIALTLEGLVRRDADLKLLEDDLVARYADAKAKIKDWLIKGSIDFLEDVKEREIPIGIVTNKERDKIESELEDLSVAHYFFSILGIDDVPKKKNKPDPYPLNLSLSKLKYKGDNGKVWFIGDSLTDMKAAVAAGCFPIYVGRLSTLETKYLRLLDEGKIMYCKSIAEVHKILKELKRY